MRFPSYKALLKPYILWSASLRKFINGQTSIPKDAFSSGQISSKLWLCREIEKLFRPESSSQTIWILGGWVGLLSFLLFSRERLNIKAIRSFEQDPLFEKKADTINENWVWQEWMFKAKTIDCNKLSYKDLFFADSKEPDLIINTSVEHFQSLKWWNNIPSGKLVVLQACDMKNKSHVNCVYSEEEFKRRFPSKKTHYSGKLQFEYPTFSFTRYMLIVEK